MNFSKERLYHILYRGQSYFGQYELTTIDGRLCFFVQGDHLYFPSEEVAVVETPIIYALVSGGKYLHGLYTDPRKAAAWIARQDKYGDWDAITALLAAGECYSCWTLIPLPVNSEIKENICL